MKIKGLIFDLDGTLLDTLPVCYIGFRTALKEFVHRDYSNEDINQLFGPSEEGIFQRLVPEQWEECLECYLETYDKVHPEYSDPFPGIEKALTLLLARKIKLAIVSGKGPKSMDLSLKHSGLGKYFSVVETGFEHGPDKPSRIRKVLESWVFDPSEVAYIGDTPHDIEDSKEVGTIPLAAVWTGTARTKGVLDKGPKEFFTNVSDFINWIEDNVDVSES
jgi:pyrophosphatase PpaX